MKRTFPLLLLLSLAGGAALLMPRARPSDPAAPPPAPAPATVVTSSHPPGVPPPPEPPLGETEDPENAEPDLARLPIQALRAVLESSDDLRERTLAARLLADRAPGTAGVAEALAEGLLIPEISATDAAKEALRSLETGAFDAIGTLRRIVDGDDRAAVRDALDLLGEMDDPTARDVLLSALRGDHGREVARAALEYVDRAGPAVLAVLLSRLGGPSKLDRLLAALAFARIEPGIRDSAVLTALAAASSDQDPVVRGSALVALIRAGEPPRGAGAEVGRMLLDGTIRGETRRAWAAGLVRGGEEADVALDAATRSEEDPGLVQFEAWQSRWRRGGRLEPLHPVVVHLLLHGDLGARSEMQEFARTLGADSAPIRRALAAALVSDDPVVRSHAEEALAALP